jgi:galactonate dehydratase
MIAPVITRLETAAVRLVGPCLLVKVWADDVYGLGECYPDGPVGAVDEMVHSLTDQLVGEDPRAVNPLYERMRRCHLPSGAQGGTALTAISGIEMALWDLAGKLADAPVHQLLGGAFRERVRLHADCHAATVDADGHHLGDAAADPTTEAGRSFFRTAVARARSRGFTALKFHVDDVQGAPSCDSWDRSMNRAQLQRLVAQVAVIKEAAGSHVDLTIDMHGRYDVPSSIRAAHALEEFDLMWLEEPLPPQNVEALAAVRRSTRTPICAGANLYTRYPFLQLLSAGAVDVVRPDLAKFGGLGEGRRVADLADLHHIPFAPHNVSGPVGTVAMAHVCAASANATVLEYSAMDVEHFEPMVTYAEGSVVQDGHVVVGDAPGLGIELNHDVAYEYRHVKSGIPFFES